jgi:hypothetical protein
MHAWMDEGTFVTLLGILVRAKIIGGSVLSTRRSVISTSTLVLSKDCPPCPQILD